MGTGGNLEHRQTRQKSNPATRCLKRIAVVRVSMTGTGVATNPFRTKSSYGPSVMAPELDNERELTARTAEHGASNGPFVRLSGISRRRPRNSEEMGLGEITSEEKPCLGLSE